MNIFVLDLDPKTCAKYHCDKHVVKMILETAQLLCNAQRKCGINPKIRIELYKETHKNHPCSIWASQSIKNYEWLSTLGIFLCDEYTERYNKIHKSHKLIQELHTY